MTRRRALEVTPRRVVAASALLAGVCYVLAELVEPGAYFYALGMGHAGVAGLGVIASRRA